MKKLLFLNRINFLSIQSIKKEYLNTTFGMGWAVVQPFVYLFVFYFANHFGFKAVGTIDGIPFIVLVFAGHALWLYMSKTLISGTQVFTKNTDLIKTIKFPVILLPIVSVISQLYVHIAVLVIVVIFISILGYPPSIYYLNFFYYWFTVVCFLSALSFLYGSISLFITDFAYLIQSTTFPLFWATPVLYTPTVSSEIYFKIFNPLYYFIHGYRETFIYQVWFFENTSYNLYIWLIILIIYLAGILLYNRVRPVMADII